MSGATPTPLAHLAAFAVTPPDERDVLTGVVLRPPGARWNGVRYSGPTLRSADAASLQGLHGVVRLVVQQNFVGIIASTRVDAAEAAVRLVLDWHDAAPGGAEPRVIWSRPAGPTPGSETLPTRRYRWPAPDDGDHAAALAWQQDGRLFVLATCESGSAARADIAALTGLPMDAVFVQTAAMPPHPAAADAAADAALLCLAVGGRPVRVDASNALDDAAVIEVGGQRDAHGDIVHCALSLTDAPWRRPSAARLLAGHTGVAGLQAAVLPPYAFAGVSVTAPSDAPLATAHSSGHTAAAFVFAHESFIDEAAAEQATDPVDFRLRHTDDPRGAALMRSVAAQAGWPTREKEIGCGQGFAYACVLDERSDPPRRTWSAWVADVAVDPRTGDIDVRRVVVGHDSEHLSEIASDAPSIESQVQQATRRLLAPPAGVDAWATPASHALQLPTVELVRAEDHRPADPAALAWTDAAALPAAAAVANAIFDATGVRLREPPFSGPAARALLASSSRGRATRRLAAGAAWLGGLAAAAAGLLVTVAPWRAEIAPIAPPDLSLYAAAALERGRLVAAAGDCGVCHTVPGGTPNAGGLGLPTPFGTVYSSNITPDVATGIGAWSYAAFERAMRHGIHRDGRHLYPAFPYTAFAKISDADLQALYAHLMSQPPVAQRAPETRLAFPYNLRAAMAGWNLLFHDASLFKPDPGQSDAWNRGAYLVLGAGHCGACHSPRNALGAEKTGPREFLAGGEAEGWEAPALIALSRAPLRWTETDFFDYLRTGYSPRHGAAAGPMAPVVHGLAQLPEGDVRAIAVYLASFSAAAPATETSLNALEGRTAPDASVWPADGERIFQGACAACHEPRGGPALFGRGPSLAPNSNLHSNRPDNLIQVILHGVPASAHTGLGGMTGFGDSLNDSQVADLTTYLRARFGDGKAAWPGLTETIARLRTAATSAGHIAR